MTTDNRTNEPTETQVKLAYLAHLKAPRTRGMDVYGPMRAALEAAARAAQGAAPQVIVCDYCGDVLPSVQGRAHIPTTPSIQRLGFSADKVVCPECVQRARGVAPVLPSGGVDEAALSRRLAEMLYDDQTGTRGQFETSTYRDAWVKRVHSVVSEFLGERHEPSGNPGQLPSVEQIAEVLSAQTTCDGEPWPSELHRRQARAVRSLFGEVA